MSLPEGKAIYLIAFSLLLSYIRKLTDQPATRIAYFFYCIYFFFKKLFISLLCQKKKVSN